MWLQITAYQIWLCALIGLLRQHVKLLHNYEKYEFVNTYFNYALYPTHNLLTNIS